MNLKDKLKSAIDESGYTITELNNQLNKRNNTDTSVQNLSAKINRGTLKYTEVEEMLGVLGYSISWSRNPKITLSEVDTSNVKLETTSEESYLLEKVIKDYSDDMLTDVYKSVVTEEITNFVKSNAQDMMKKTLVNLFAGSGGLSHETLSINKEPQKED